MQSFLTTDKRIMKVCTNKMKNDIAYKPGDTSTLVKIFSKMALKMYLEFSKCH